MPLAHLLLHFMWSPKAAWIASALSVWGLGYLVAEYRATLARPVSFDRDNLYIRCGVLSADAVIPWHQIQSIEVLRKIVRRQPGVRRYKQMGELNIAIHLQQHVLLPDLIGRKQLTTQICLSLDDAEGFIKAASVNVG